MVISKKDKQKFKKAVNAKNTTQETSKRGRWRPSKNDKLENKNETILKEDIGVIENDVMDELEINIQDNIILNDSSSIESNEKSKDIEEIEDTMEENTSSIPNFLDDEEVQEAIAEKKDEINSQRQELEDIDETIVDEVSDMPIKEEQTDNEMFDLDEEIDLNDFETEEYLEKEDDNKKEEEKSHDNFENEEIDLNEIEEISPQESHTTQNDINDLEEGLEELKDFEQDLWKEEVKVDANVTETPEEINNQPVDETKKMNVIDKLKHHKNKIIIGAVALAIAGVWVFAFKDKIFWTAEPIKPVVQNQQQETPINEDKDKEKVETAEIKEKNDSGLFAKVELSEEKKYILNKLIPMSMNVEKWLQEIYDAKKTNETNHWTIKTYDKKYKKTNIMDVQSQLSQNLQDIKWVDEAEDNLAKGKSDTDADGNELSPEDKLKKENNPALSVKKYNGDEGDVKWELKTSLTIKQGKEQKYGFKINADIEWKREKTHLFFKNFGINTKDQDLIDKSELDKFSLQNKMLTISSDKNNVDILNLLGEYRTQLLGFNIFANIINNAEIEWSDETVSFEKEHQKATSKDETTEHLKDLVTTSSNGVKEETNTSEEHKAETNKDQDTENKIQDTKEDWEAQTKSEGAIENEKQEDQNVNKEEHKEMGESKQNSKASYKINISGKHIKNELEKVLKTKDALVKIFLDTEEVSPFKEFVSSIQDDDKLQLHYDVKENKAMISWNLAGYKVSGVYWDKEEILLSKEDKEIKVKLTITDSLIGAKIVQDKQELIFESGFMEKEGIYKTNFLFSKNIIKKNWKKSNVYKLSNKGILAKDNEQLPVYAKDYTDDQLKGKYEVNFNFITSEYKKLIDKFFGIKELKQENDTSSSEKKEESQMEVKEENTSDKEHDKKVDKKEVKKEEETNSKEDLKKNPIKEVFKEVEKEDAKVLAGSTAEQPK